VAVPTVARLTNRPHRKSRWEDRRFLRRSLLCLASLLSASLALAPLAWGAPTVTFTAKAVPISGFPGTGNILGAGAAVEVQFSIAGTEYGGFPSPLVELNAFAPAGVKVASTGFATCAQPVLEAGGAGACPKKSSAGPPGVALGVVAFGGERVPEQVSIQEFFAPAGLFFYAEGKSPASFQIIEKARWVTAGPPFGPELMAEVPLVETVPGADDASVTAIKAKVGAAYRKGGKTVSYITLPKKCPRGGFPVKAELKFLSGEVVTVTYSAPCPRR
jgi:hypothetical protein